MKDYIDRVEKAAGYIADSLETIPEIAVVLGTGLGAFVEKLDVQHRIPYGQIPGMTLTNVQSHRGELIVGMLREKSVSDVGKMCFVLSGRLHYYEGHSMQEVTFATRVLGVLGVKRLILTNAAGSLNPVFKAGETVCISDHINMLPENPLRGINIDAWGPRFPDMSEVYNMNMRQRILEFANKKQIKVHEGTYLATSGPNLETKAEYHFFHTIGADLVGMSTIPEVIVAKHMGIDVLAFSVVSNVCYPVEMIEEVSIDDVINTVRTGEENLSMLLSFAILDNDKKNG